MVERFEYHGEIKKAGIQLVKQKPCATRGETDRDGWVCPGDVQDSRHDALQVRLLRKPDA